VKGSLCAKIFRALVCLGISIGHAFALPGDLDSSFGTGGIVTTAIGSGDDTATGVVAQPDGKIVVAGTSNNGSNKDFAVARYKPDGTLDTSFRPSGTGKVTCDFRENDDVCNGVVLQGDGKIVVVGYSSDGTRNDFALARFNPDGSLDTGFGQAGTGKVVTTGLGADSEALAVVLQADGMLVVAGVVSGADAVVRYHDDGTIDDGFGSGGLLRYGMPGGHYSSAVFGVSIQADGRIVVTGYGSAQFYPVGVHTARIDADGQRLDPDFPAPMMVSNSFIGRAVALQSDGRIVVADSGFNLLRLNIGGTLDTGFGGTGIVGTSIGIGSSAAKGLVLQGDGRIVAAGYSYNGNTGFNDFAVVRCNPDGSMDTGFHRTGKVTTHIGNGDAYGESVALQVDGRILVAGRSMVGGKYRFTLARYHAFGNLAVTSPANGGYSNNPRPVISGPADANATVNVWLDGNSAGSTMASADGVWSYTPTDTLADGTQTVSVTETDTEGHTVATSNTNNFTVDTVAPEAPVVSTPANGTFVNNTRPYISGTAEANAKVEIHLDGVAVGTVTVNGAGTWGFVPASSLLDGLHTVKAI